MKDLFLDEMKLKFLGTRGNIEAKTNRHKMHSSLMVAYYHQSVMIDCGEDWLGRTDSLQMDAIVLTHAHPDHAYGLKEGVDCPVYATRDSLENIAQFPIKNQHVIIPREPFGISGITFEAFPVDHSTNAPAVGYRITAGKNSIFYVPDVVYIHFRHDALYGTKLYIGDGATIADSMVRKPGEELVGHTPVRTQLTWCQKENVPKMLVTHCGSEIVEGDERTINAELRSLADERDVEVQIAYDSLELVL